MKAMPSGRIPRHEHAPKQFYNQTGGKFVAHESLQLPCTRLSTAQLWLGHQHWLVGQVVVSWLSLQPLSPVPVASAALSDWRFAEQLPPARPKSQNVQLEQSGLRQASCFLGGLAPLAPRNVADSKFRAKHNSGAFSDFKERLSCRKKKFFNSEIN